jgi:hypothetical protein
MYGLAWNVVVGVLVVLGIVLVAGLGLAAPLFALLALAILVVGAFAYFAGRRGRIGSERERVRQGVVGPAGSGDGAPVSGEGGERRKGDGYEPAL